MLNDDLIARIRRIEITTRKLVDESFTGEYQSVFKGRGMEFDEVRQYHPGDDVRTDDELLDYARRKAETGYHPAGTCKMGPDPMAVVDAELRVHGIDALRVVDASIMPTLTSGNINAPAMMIGEKGADLILGAK